MKIKACLSIGYAGADREYILDDIDCDMTEEEIDKYVWEYMIQFVDVYWERVDEDE